MDGNTVILKIFAQYYIFETISKEVGASFGKYFERKRRYRQEVTGGNEEIRSSDTFKH